MKPGHKNEFPNWVVLDSDEAERSQLLYGASEGVGTVDELGFGRLYDQVANDLFPWCSTLTTRAKYFFTSSVILDFAVRETCNPLSELEKADEGKVHRLAMDSIPRIVSSEKKYEKYLAIAIYALGNDREGLFGKRRIQKWENASDRVRNLHECKEILKTIARYPNRIYRGSCKKLDMFSSERHADELALVKRRLIGLDSAISDDWISASTSTSMQIKSIIEFLGNLEEESRKIKKSGKNSNFEFGNTLAAVSKRFRRFNGFKLQKEEALLLKSRIFKQSAYLEAVPKSKIVQIWENASSGLSQLSRTLAKNDQDKFLSAHHIDKVTTPFRQLYDEIVANPQAKSWSTEIDRDAIMSSLDWLDRRCYYDHWGEYSKLIAGWMNLLPSERSDRSKLVFALCNRAEMIVGENRGKVPPHKETGKKRALRDIEGIRAEVDFRSSSFRLWNAGRILKDVFEVLDEK